MRDYELCECIGRGMSQRILPAAMFCNILPGTYAECFRARCLHCDSWLCIKRLDKSDIIRRKHVACVRSAAVV